MAMPLFLRCAVLACLAAAPLGCGGIDPPTSPSAAVPAPPPPAAPAEVQSLVARVNQHRAGLGLAPLAWDARVATVAQAHSQDMVDRGYFAHTSPDGIDPFERLAAAGIAHAAAGENIAYGYPTASAVLAAWLGSPGHRANLESAAYTHHGIGLVGTHWTHVFIRPR
jgi:uncharacterized protein YkwD